MSQSLTLFLRGDTTVTLVSGQVITLFELAGRSNVILGVTYNPELEKALYAPIMIKVKGRAHNEGLFSVSPISGLEVDVGGTKLAFGMPFKDIPTMMGLQNEKVQILIDDENYSLLYQEPCRQADVKILYDMEVIDASLTFKPIHETRLYYETTFDIIHDISHCPGDYILALLNQKVLIAKWLKF